MMKKPAGQMMVMLLPEHVMGALKGGDEASDEGEPVDEASGEDETMDEEMMGKGKMKGKTCPTCGSRC
jgi:hypothetical protein